MVRAWTDRSEQKGLDGRAYAGYGVWFGYGHIQCGREPTRNSADKQQSRNDGGAECVLELQICTDLQLVVDAIQYWMKGWERRGWKTKAGKQVENEDLWREIKAATEDRTGRTEVIAR